MKKTVALLTSILVFLFSQLISNVSYAEEWVHGRVNRIFDGDTIMIVDRNSNKYIIRLDQIDAPETKQPYSRQSSNTLLGLIRHKHVAVQIHDVDRYERLIGTVYLNDSNVNLFMVRSGMAWAYTQYVRDTMYFEAERLAKVDGLGIWASEEEQTPPWDYRRLQQEKDNENVPVFRVE